jgi:hypothetical protein
MAMVMTTTDNHTRPPPPHEKQPPKMKKLHKTINNNITSILFLIDTLKMPRETMAQFR